MIILATRIIIIYFAVVLLMRMLGKRQMGELELSELVLSILIADVASIPLQNPELPIYHGLLPAALLFALEYLMSYMTMKSVFLRKVFCGQPSFLVVKGVIQQKAMRASRYTVDELSEELRNHSITDISTVQYAVLETDGTLNAILFPEHRTPTAAELNLSPPDDGYATIIIAEGKLFPHNLQLCGLDEKWLKKELLHRGCGSVKQVYALIYYESGKIYFAERE